VQFPPDPAEYPPWRWTFDVPDATGCLDTGRGLRVNTGYGDGGLLPPAGKWQHVVGVVDGKSLTVSLYVGGRHLTTERAEYSLRASGRLLLGRGQSPDVGFVGSIDELRIYGRAFSAAEVAGLFAADVAAR